MSSLELNKFAAAILLAGVVAMSAGFFANLATHPHELEEAVYAVEGVAGDAASEGAEAPAGPEPVLPLLAAADPASGQAISKKCAACHTFDEGGANKIGPNLHGVVNRPIASHEGFAYSDALGAHAEEAWSYQHLNAFLAKPKNFAPGTKMTFAGLSKVSDRADMIAYLRSLSGSPAPLPTEEEIAAATAAPEGDEAPAEEAAPAEAAAEEAPAAEAPAEEAPAGQAPAEEAPAADAPAEEAPAEEAPAPATEAPAEDAPAEQSAEAPAADAPAEPATASAAATGLAGMIATVEPDAAKKVSRKCAACHSFESGGKNKIGPNLYGVIGRPIASHEGFAYSNALKEKAGESWTYENLMAFIGAPKDFAPGTKMTFAGLRKLEDVAAILAFLQTYHDNPPPAPE